jgi:hypothetical protein
VLNCSLPLAEDGGWEPAAVLPRSQTKSTSAPSVGKTAERNPGSNLLATARRGSRLGTRAIVG